MRPVKAISLDSFSHCSFDSIVLGIVTSVFCFWRNDYTRSLCCLKLNAKDQHALVEFQKAVEKYSDEFRRNDLDELVESEIFSLDKNNEIRSTSPTLYWPDTWPLSHCRGVYGIFSHEKLSARCVS
jgi:hypothetical protein